MHAYFKHTTHSRFIQIKNELHIMEENNLNYLDRNEFNFSPSPEVAEALTNFDVNKLCFYTRIYD